MNKPPTAPGSRQQAVREGVGVERIVSTEFVSRSRLFRASGKGARRSRFASRPARFPPSVRNRSSANHRQSVRLLLP